MSEKDKAEQELRSTVMAVIVLRENSSLLQQPKETGIIIDGVEVLNELPSVATRVVMLFGLCYALNMEYPQGFRFTFEALQKILMELGSNKMSLFLVMHFITTRSYYLSHLSILSLHF